MATINRLITIQFNFGAVHLLAGKEKST